MIRKYNKNDKTINYKIIYKKIKHVYFRNRNGVIVVSANKKLKEDYILNLLDANFDNIYKLSNHQTKSTTKTYQLWGSVLTENEFYNDLIQNENNYYKILKKETYKQINTLRPQLLKALEKLNLKEVEIKVKPLKSKFGSCHITKKYITINSFLAKLEPIYLYYVLIHEYAHFIVANHSKEFYDTISKVLKDHKTIQKSLRKHIITFIN